VRAVGGPLETGLRRSVAGVLVFLFAPLLVVANLPLPGLVGAAWLVAAVVLMLRSPSSDAFAWRLRALCAFLALWLAVTGVTLFGRLHPYVAVLSVGAYAAVFVAYAAALAQLARDVGQGRIARAWSKAAFVVWRAGVALVGITTLAVMAKELTITGHRYDYSTEGIASLTMLTPIAVIAAVTLRRAHLFARTRLALRTCVEFRGPGRLSSRKFGVTGVAARR
jgi:hypothetical protein